ncbi:MAG: isoprenylcysteine carboxylmethyltransferase family protein [Gammaproteobacteria bacterium]|nr:isoprenylcysteine carboxylmethyltransferase family protein [Gammaproteobacteria bacterium]
MALMVLLLFLLVAVVGRIAMQYRISGDHGIRPVKKTSTKIAIISSSLLIVSFISIFILTVLDITGMLKPFIEHNQLTTIAGIVISLTGITLTVTSQYQMGKAWRIGVDESEKTELVTNGIYSLIRNPIYSGVFIFGFGLLVLFPNPYMLISLAIAYFSIEIHVRYVEEPYLLRLHGEAFKEYVNKSGRYLPNFNHEPKKP